ncbi:hypothetical protein [Devosia sp.]|uniref:hypothetical protein n=1 Tax=Devosia sp. TaxID=1871048 RepID=UPI003BAC1DA9
MIGIVAFPMLIMASLRGSPPTFLFSYDIEMVASFKVEGQPAEARRVAKCDVMKGGEGVSGAGNDLSAVFARVSEGDNAYVVLPDGSAIVFFLMSPCLWKKSPPGPGTSLALNAVDRGGSYRDLPKADGSMAGRVAWLRSANRPAPIEYFELDEFAYDLSPRIADFSLSVSATDDAPTSSLTSDIPITSQLVLSASYLHSFERGPRATNVVLTPWIATVEQVTGQRESQDCQTAIAGFAKQAGWVPITYGLCFGVAPRRSAELMVSSDFSRVDIDLRSAPRTGELTFTVDMLEAAGVPTSLKGAGDAMQKASFPYFQWAWKLCLEQQCFDITAQDDLHGHFQFYHPVTGRGVSFFQDSSPTDFTQ